MPADKAAKATDNTPEHSEFTNKSEKKNVRGAKYLSWGKLPESNQ
jgi:hypothetical protein